MDTMNLSADYLVIGGGAMGMAFPTFSSPKPMPP